MKRLRSRLSRLRTESGGDYAAPVSATGSELQRRLARIQSQRLSAEPGSFSERTSEEALAKQLKGYLIAEGVIQIQRRLPLDHRFGHCSLALLRDSQQLPGEGREAHLRQVYVDTETTGLSTGSGTCAFLVGMALVERDALVVTQYLLSRFAGEGAMLAAFSRALTPEDRLVSYNGKSFDLPLLLTRYRMLRQPQFLEELAHLDLLHPVRRLFGRRWPDCRLSTLERRLLGFRRRQDLPGAEAPAAWADYLRQGRATQLLRVVGHNRQDLVSLALAHGVVARAVAAPDRHGVDVRGLAQWLSKFDGRAAYTLLKSTGQTLDDQGKRLLGQLARRAQDWKLAVKTWEELAAGGCQHSLAQLAKYHEHISGDLPSAQCYCARLDPGAEQTRRLARIEAKLSRQRSQASLLGGVAG